MCLRLVRRLDTIFLQAHSEPHNDRYQSNNNDCNMTSHQNGHPFRNGLINQAGNKRRTSDELPSFLGSYIPVLPSVPAQWHPSSSRLPTHVDWKQTWRRSMGLIGRLRSWRAKDLLVMPLALIIIWWVVLWWGEEVIFRRSVESCVWSNWESWVFRLPSKELDRRTRADFVFSLLQLLLTMSPLSLILNWSTRTPIQDALGPFLHLRSATLTSIFANLSSRSRLCWLRLQSSS